VSVDALAHLIAVGQFVRVIAVRKTGEDTNPSAVASGKVLARPLRAPESRALQNGGLLPVVVVTGMGVGAVDILEIFFQQ